MATDNSADRSSSPAPGEKFLFLAGLAGLILVLFGKLFAGDSVLFNTDANAGQIQLAKSFLPRSLLGGWNDTVLAGVPQNTMSSMFVPFLLIMSAQLWANLLYPLYLFSAAVFLALFLRERGCRWPSAAIGVMTALFLGSNFTLLYAGHQGKFTVLMFASLSLWLLERGARRNSSLLLALAGAALGFMFPEQPDVALLFAAAIGLYSLRALWREGARGARAWLRLLAPLVAAAAIPFGISAYTAYLDNIKGASIEQQDAAQKWAFATQWSWPPEETIDFIAPGYMGWRSGEPAGPYWGRMGGAAEQGMRNFKLENQYLGLIPLILAVMGAVAAWRRREFPPGVKTDLRFWSILAGACFLLALGKYFPMYFLLFKLPLFSSIRNPNKFLQIFQFGLGILAAHGMDALLTFGVAVKKEKSEPFAWIRKFTWVLLGLGGLLALWMLGVMAVWGGSVQEFAAEGWGPYSEIIVRNRFLALAHAAGLAFVAAGFIHAIRGTSRGRPAALAWALALVVAADAAWLSRHYVKPSPMSFFAMNEPLKTVQAANRENRTTMMTREGFYNTWLTFQFPFHQIRCTEIPQMPRMPEDYRLFLTALNAQPIRKWQLCAVSTIMAPSGVWDNIQKDPGARSAFELLHSYNAVQKPDMTIQTAPGTAEQPGAHCVLGFKLAAPRFMLVKNWRIMPDNDALKTLADPEISPFETILVSPDTAEGLPQAAGDEGAEIAVAVKELESGHAVVSASCEKPCILRFSERFTPNWTVRVDGRRQKLRRVDFLFQGVFIEPGLHEVSFDYRPANLAQYVQLSALIAWAAALAAGILALLRSRQSGA